MNLSVTLSLPNVSLTDLGSVLARLEAIGPIESLNAYRAERSPTVSATDSGEAITAEHISTTAETKATPGKAETPAAKKKRLAAEKKAERVEASIQADKAKPEDEAVAEAVNQAALGRQDEVDDLLDDGSGGEVTKDMLLLAVSAAIKRTDINTVKTVFKGYKAKKISELATEHYKSVHADLEAL